MSTIYLMSGLPFSGKSTLSKAISQHLNIPRISFDEVWVELTKDNGSIPGSDEIERWRYVSQLCEQRIADSLQKGTSVVYDNLGDNLTNRQHIRNLALQNNAETKIIYLDISKEEVIRRRESNLSTQERHQVSDNNFNSALNSFEPPYKKEDPLIFTSDQEVEVWIDKELKAVTASREIK